MSRKNCPNKKNKKIQLVCVVCLKTWIDFPSRKNRMICSRSCAGKNNKKAHFKRNNKINVGRKYSESTKKKISISNKIAWSDVALRKKMSDARQGKDNPNWKSVVTYSTIHKWLVRKYGKANRCEAMNCDATSKQFNWALLKGKRYCRKKESFIQLCRACHNSYDRTGGKNVRCIELPTKQQ